MGVSLLNVVLTGLMINVVGLIGMVGPFIGGVAGWPFLGVYVVTAAALLVSMNWKHQGRNSISQDMVEQHPAWGLLFYLMPVVAPVFGYGLGWALKQLVAVFS